MREVFTADFSAIQVLQSQWDRVLGAENNLGPINYNPVLARWNFERTQTIAEKVIFRDFELQNIMTALGERNQTSESHRIFRLDTYNKFRNDLFPNEPYEDVLQRGVAYRKKEGSQEQEREQSETMGFAFIEEAFTDPEMPFGAKFIVISPPGLIGNTAYPHNFVDIYELMKDPQTQERYMRYTRFASSLTYSRYKDLVEELQPNYFYEQDGPIDAWFLGHPIPVPDFKNYEDAHEVFARYFQKDVTAMDKWEFQKRWQVYLPFVYFYLDTLMQSDFEPIRVAEAWNTVLHSTENEKLKQQLRGINFTISDQITYLDRRSHSLIAAMVEQYGREEVREIKAGCGKSRGFKMNQLDTLDPAKALLLANSVAQFGQSDLEQKWFRCPKCDYQATGPVGNKCPNCDITKEKYAKSGEKMCA